MFSGQRNRLNHVSLDGRGSVAATRQCRQSIAVDIVGLPPLTGGIGTAYRRGASVVRASRSVLHNVGLSRNQIPLASPNCLVNSVGGDHKWCSQRSSDQARRWRCGVFQQTSDGRNYQQKR